MSRKTDWVGKTVYEICEYVESEIKKRGAKCAFPVNTSINEVAAHYTQLNQMIQLQLQITIL